MLSRKTPPRRFQQFIDSLPDMFRIGAAIRKGSEEGLSTSAVRKYVRQGLEGGIIVRISHGRYQRVSKPAKAAPSGRNVTAYAVDTDPHRPCIRYAVAYSPRQAGLHFGLQPVQVFERVIALDYLPRYVDVNLTKLDDEAVVELYKARASNQG